MSYLYDEIYERDGNDKSSEGKNKIIIMGLQAAGKTAIKELIFLGKSQEEVENYMATTHYTRHFLDESKQNVIIDSGGQESYFNEAVTYYRNLIFSDAKLLVWVVDISSPDLFEESERRFSFTIRQFKKKNPDGIIYVFCHKSDLVETEKIASIVQYLKGSLHDPKFEINFRITSIYDKLELNETCKEMLVAANIRTDNLELVTNVEGDEEVSQDQISFIAETDSNQKIQLLSKFMAKKPRSQLPTFGKLEVDVDLEGRDIIEIVLLDKENFSPSLGASSHRLADKGNSMDYLLALNYFKKTLKEKGKDIPVYESIIDSYNSQIWACIYNIKHYYLLITSFSEITQTRGKEFEDLIKGFAEIIKKKEQKVSKEDFEVKEVAKPITEPTREISQGQDVNQFLTQENIQETQSKEENINGEQLKEIERNADVEVLKAKYRKLLEESKKREEQQRTQLKDEIQSDKKQEKDSLITFSSTEMKHLVNFFIKNKKRAEDEEK